MKILLHVLKFFNLEKHPSNWLEEQLKSVAAFWFPSGAGPEIRMISGSFGI